jgi:hypothetical protein
MGGDITYKGIVPLDYNYLCTYDLYSPVHNVLDACIFITRGSGRGLGPVILEFLTLGNGIEPIGECHLHGAV